MTKQNNVENPPHCLKETPPIPQESQGKIIFFIFFLSTINHEDKLITGWRLKDHSITRHVFFPLNNQKKMCKKTYKNNV